MTEVPPAYAYKLLPKRREWNEYTSVCVCVWPTACRAVIVEAVFQCFFITNTLLSRPFSHTERTMLAKSKLCTRRRTKRETHTCSRVNSISCKISSETNYRMYSVFWGRWSRKAYKTCDKLIWAVCAASQIDNYVVPIDLKVPNDLSSYRYYY